MEDRKWQCNTCNSDESMAETRIAKFDKNTRNAAVMLLIPMLILVVYGLQNYSQSPDQGFAFNLGSALGQGLVYLVTSIFGLGALACIVVGWYLLSSHRVFTCGKCGAVEKL